MRPIPIGIGVAVATLVVLGVLWVGPPTRTAAGPTGPPSEPPPATGAGPLPSDPANCAQGSHTIVVPPLGLGQDEDSLFLTDYNQLGGEGGGTLQLTAGDYQFNQTVQLDSYDNISIQGSGIGSTILTVPANPIQHFRADNGTPVGLFNTTAGTQTGPAANLFNIGPVATNDFEMCDLTLDAEVSGNNETWAGSLVFDNGGGARHIYTDIGEVGFWGPSGTPNGIHLNGFTHPASGYIVDDLFSTNYTAPYGAYDGVAHGGPDFLDTGDIADSSIENILGVGNFEIEEAPDVGCVFADIFVTGHGLVDPATGTSNPAYHVAAGSWGGTILERVVFDTENTPAPNALGVALANGSGSGGSDFYGMYWDYDSFVGTVLGAANMVNVQNSTFFGTVDSLPAVFTNDTVIWNVSAPSRQLAELPIEVDGIPAGGTGSTLMDDVFEFSDGTYRYGGSGYLDDPFALNVALNVWYNVTVKINGPTPGFLFEAPGITLSRDSSLTDLVYDSLGNGSPATLELLDTASSKGFSDQGATVANTTSIVNNLP